MAVSADFLFSMGWGSSLRFAKIFLYHLHLSGCEDAFVASVADVLQGLEQAPGLAEFLAEEADGTLVAAVGVVEHGQAAEVAHVAAGV